MKSPMLPFVLAAVPAIMATVIAKRKFNNKQLLAAFLFGAIVWGLWELNEDVAAAFAWVAAITSLLINGRVVIQSVTGRL